jgi:transforming growth factor-beta-induced protein
MFEAKEHVTKQNVIDRGLLAAAADQGETVMHRIRLFLPILAAVVLSVAVASPLASARPAADGNIVQTAVAAGKFTTLASLLTQSGLADTLSSGGPYTVFAPTDEAFAKVPKATLDALAADPAKLKSVLLYHVVSGNVGSADVVKLTSAKTLDGKSVAIKVSNGSVFIDAAKVTTPDVAATNGVIHIVDSVLMPAETAMAPTKNIVQTAKAAGQFKTLTSLLTKAGLASTLQGKGPFTVFAPTDAAFAKVPKATLSALAADKAKLKAVLLYHVAKGNVTANKVVKLKSAKTLNGKPVSISVSGSKVMVGGARVTTADIATTNGVIHVINKVLIP